VDLTGREFCLRGVFGCLSGFWDGEGGWMANTPRAVSRNYYGKNDVDDSERGSTVQPFVRR
jgi:hypothetical protein